MSNARPAVLALCLSAALFSCGPGTLVPSMPEPPRSAGSRADFRAKVSLGTELATLRGQSLVSVELMHRHQPAEALLAVQRARRFLPLIEASGGANAQPEFVQLGRALDDAIGRLRRPDQSGALTEALAAAGRATLGIESKYVGATSERSAYRASVVSLLAWGAAAQYDLAVASGAGTESYREAYGSLREAENIHEGLATVVEEQTNDHSRAADTLLAAMFGAMPSSDPPSDLPRPLEVSAAAYILGVLLADDHGALAPPAPSHLLFPIPPRDRLVYMAPLLKEVLGSYESGEAGVADVLLEKVRASLCCPTSSAGDALEAELALLSNAIRSGAPDSGVQTLVERSSELAEDAA